METQNVLTGIRKLRLQVETQADVDARKGLASRHLVFQAKNMPGLSDVALAVEVGLDTFERALVEKHSRHAIEAARTSLLATLDAMIRRLSSS